MRLRAAGSRIRSSSSRLTITPASNSSAGMLARPQHRQVVEIVHAVRLVRKRAVLSQHGIGVVARRREARLPSAAPIAEAHFRLASRCGFSLETNSEKPANGSGAYQRSRLRSPTPTETRLHGIVVDRNEEIHARCARRAAAKVLARSAVVADQERLVTRAAAAPPRSRGQAGGCTRTRERRGRWSRPAA